MSITQLLYTSHPRVDMSMSEVDSILSRSRRNNPEAGLTGFLMYRHDLFLQMLEGPHDEVLRVFDKIAVDPRHADVCVVGTVSSKERFFPDWNMGYLSLTPANMALLGESFDATDFQANALSFDELADFMVRLSEKARESNRLLA